MKEFLKYFLGQGTEIEFENFTLPHFLPIAILIAVIFLTYRFRDKLRTYKHEDAIRMFLAFALIFSEMSYYWRLVAMPSLGPNPIDHLPITVCGWGVVFCSYMLVSKNQSLFDICYFWALGGSVFALITPTVISYTGPTRFRYYQFWLEHTLGYVGVFYMIFVHGMRPTIKSAIRATFWLVVLAVIAFFTNRMLGPGANYLFLAAPESTPSVLDILPPNFALRTLIMAAAVLVLFGVAYLPWYLIDRKAAKKKEEVPV
ncbi:MAG: TIGR02206 family membrane protein [Oscillospiraceae bacterium]|nr:TIGR02206 family membrane protein [Oscillospiraceae bacterium]